MDVGTQRRAASQFVKNWAGRGNEERDGRSFWIELLQQVYGVNYPTRVLEFEKPVPLQHVSFIDVFIPSTRVLIEQKSVDVDLSKATRQSDGTELTPFEQGKRYADALPNSKRPRYIVACNFQTFEIHDLEAPQAPPILVKLEDLPRCFDSLYFLTDLDAKAKQAEKEISVKAGQLVAKLYDALLKQYGDGREHDPSALLSLNKLCVRIVFCLYAEDSGVFPIKKQFGRLLNTCPPDIMAIILEKLFSILDTPEVERPKSLPEEYNAFPYVDGGLFASTEKVEIPPFNQEIAAILLDECSGGFDWSKISPTIFGAIFESTLNPETRRHGGMHYTSPENIHKVIDPLFLKPLQQELKSLLDDPRIHYVKKGGLDRLSIRRLLTFKAKLGSLRFLDPACGSGNFLTETYISLRTMENEILQKMSGNLVDLFITEKEYSPVQVKLESFYGIEINDFAVSVAKTALWIAENQLLQETEQIIGKKIDFLPLTSAAHIKEDNALRLDWKSVLKPDDTVYVMGNPPFFGARLMTASQKEDLKLATGSALGWGDLDYVTGWYYQAARYMSDNRARCGFVSTNSISQGLHVEILRRDIFKAPMQINFAYQSFPWNNEAVVQAHVHCVIIGFSCFKAGRPKLFTENGVSEVSRINGYLREGEDLGICNRTAPLCDVPAMGIGNKPIDGGFYLFKQAEKEAFLEREPGAAAFFRPWWGAREFLNDCPRYCLWLGDSDSPDLRDLPECRKRVDAVKNFRLRSKSPGTRKLATQPTHFHVESMPKTPFLCIPKLTSNERDYLPVGILEPPAFASDLMLIIPTADLYMLGVLSSRVHFLWMAAVCGRFGQQYRYSVGLVYNNFIWPQPAAETKDKIKKTAAAILDARAAYPRKCLAALYDRLLMTTAPLLRKAHIANDKAVLSAYGWPKSLSDEEILTRLFALYHERVMNGEPPPV